MTIDACCIVRKVISTPNELVTLFVIVVLYVLMLTKVVEDEYP